VPVVLYVGLDKLNTRGGVYVPASRELCIRKQTRSTARTGPLYIRLYITRRL
jgi:hypothetical protein